MKHKTKEINPKKRFLAINIPPPISSKSCIPQKCRGIVIYTNKNVTN
ncbi:hypothetical protein LLB_0875 [Legionella longbeachae D-4968]|nr:hypothetical protein LLB_0875 [Legionella longbeachae D-4968]